MKTWISAAGAALLAVAASTAAADTTTYSIDRGVGSGTVTGTITTDGTFGQLSTTSFTAWNLMLFDGINTYSLVSAASQVFVLGGDLSADASHLYFNFSGVDVGVLLFQQNLFSGAHYYCDATQAASFYCRPGESIVPNDVFSNPAFPRAVRSGTIAIADAAVVSSVPEPATVATLALGLAWLGARSRRHPGRAVTPAAS